MIQFFRKIRQNLLMENKTGKPAFVASKYLKYAIGEIVLVVVGILIALQINNWSQKHKNDQLAYVFLTDFKHDLQTDVESLKKRINRNNLMSSSVDSIFITIATKKDLSIKECLTFFELNRSLSYESYFIPEKITIRQFETGNNSSLLSSKELKNKLFKYYSENDRNEMNGEQSTQLYQHLFLTKEIIQPILSGEILSTIIGFNLGVSNLVLNDLVLNPSYIWSLVVKKGVADTQTSQYKNIITMAEDLIKSIDSELEK